MTDTTKMTFEIRDPIHRTIAFSENEKRIIDHPYVQRLRNVRQLGLAYLVYPGATHDRFTHALGAMHVAGRMWQRIRETSGEVLARHFSAEDLDHFGRIVRIAGLTHDLGHPPFSHMSERFMPSLSALNLPEGWLSPKDPERQATHEDYSVLLIAGLASEKDGPLDEEAARDISSLIHHEVAPSPSWAERFGTREDGKGGIHKLLRSLISGELDCDRMDYLLRDAYYTGVAYGAHDIDHLIANLGVVELDDGVLMRTIDSTAVRAFEDFLLARYHMFIQVYMHKTTIAFDRFLDEALQAKEFTVDMPGDAEGYADLRDSTLMERLYAAAKDEKNVWSRRLVGRKTAKLILTASNIDADDRRRLDIVRRTLDEASIPYFTIASRQYLSKATPVILPDMAQSAMLVRRKMFGKHMYEPIEKYSDLLKKYNEVIDATNIYVLPEEHEAARRALDSVV